MLQGMVQGIIGSRRLSAFLLSPEVETSDREMAAPSDEHPLAISNGSFQVTPGCHLARQSSFILEFTYSGVP